MFNHNKNNGIQKLLNHGRASNSLRVGIISIFTLSVISPSFGQMQSSRILWKARTTTPKLTSPCTESGPLKHSSNNTPYSIGTELKPVNFHYSHPQWLVKKAEISATSGLVLKDVKLETQWKDNVQKEKLDMHNGTFRMMAPLMGIDRYWLMKDGVQQEVKNLRPSMLIDSGTVVTNGNRLYIWAEYKDPDLNKCVVIRQDYNFYRSETDHEPHKLAPNFGLLGYYKNISYYASRWVPKVSYKNFPRTNAPYYEFGLKTRQNFDLNSSNTSNRKSPQVRQLLRDIDVSTGLKAEPDSLGNSLFLTPFVAAYYGKQDDNKQFKVIENGVSVTYSDYDYYWIDDDGQSHSHKRFNPDNLHQTHEKGVDWPKGFVTRDMFGEWSLQDKFSPAPGCPECIHIHWRWTDTVHNLAWKGDPQNIFGQGRAMIPRNSKQTVEVGFVPNTDRFVYTATGKGNVDEFFGHGGFYSGQGTIKTP